MGELNRDKIDAGTLAHLEPQKRYLTGVFTGIGAFQRLIRQSTSALTAGDAERAMTLLIAALAAVYNVIRIANSPPRGWERVGQRFARAFGAYSREMARAFRDIGRGRVPKIHDARHQRAFFDAYLAAGAHWLEVGGDADAIDEITAPVMAA